MSSLREVMFELDSISFEVDNIAGYKSSPAQNYYAPTQ